MAIDNVRVSQIIQKALDNNQRLTIKDSLEWAWREVNAKRESGGAVCGDESLAAADHYLFLRSYTFCYPGLASSLLILTVSYDGLYKGYADAIKKLTGQHLVFETGKCPPSKFSSLVVLWGRAGIKDGLFDAMSLIKQTIFGQNKKLTAPSPNGYLF